MIYPLEYFRSERDDFHESFAAQFTGNRPKYTGADWLELCIQQDGRIAIKANERTIRTSDAFSGTHNNSVIYIAFFNFATGDCVFDAHFDDIPDASIAAM
jgi:hypothetical protein